MIFNKHFELAGRHAFLSPSKYHWINYDDDKLDATYIRALAAQRGTDLHNLAHEAIRLGVKIQSPKTIKMYVNDGIGYKMHCEQILKYSDNAFGSADTLCFRRNKLRVHDLKTGETACSEKQLFVYDALFCLEYGYTPFEIEIENRIYQNDDMAVFIPDPDEIVHIMDRIITFDKRINVIREEALS